MKRPKQDNEIRQLVSKKNSKTAVKDCDWDCSVLTVNPVVSGVQVLERFDIPDPCAAMEFNIEAFL